MTSMREAWADHLVTLAATDDRLVLLDADLANSTKAERFAGAHPERFVQLGIAEQNLVGTAVGMASMGYVPWLSSFTVFFTHRALDPLRMLVAQTGANVKVAAAYSGLLTGLTGRTHQDVQDLAIMRAMPGMVVLAPLDATECRSMMDWSCRYHGPVYLRLARDASVDVSGGEFHLGEVRVMRTGAKVALVSTGVQSTRTLQAADLLAAQGLDATVIHVPTIKPLATASLLHALQGHDRVVSVEEHTVLGGLGGLVAETLAGTRTDAVLTRIGIDDVWGESAPNDFLLDRHGLSAARIADQVRKLVENVPGGRLGTASDGVGLVASA